MKKQADSVAERFTVYHELGWWIDRWWFRRFLRWVSNDEYSVQLLLNFERKIERGSLSSGQVSRTIIHALTWYNREDHNERIADRLPHDKLSDFLQIVLGFLEKRQKIDYSIRDLFLKILRAVEDFEKNDRTISRIRPDQFRSETIELFSNLTSKWEKWYSSQNSGGDRLLLCLRHIAGKASDIQLFKQFCLEIQKELFLGSFYKIEEKLECLENIADKVQDTHSFTKVFAEIVPAIGLGPTSGLMRSSSNLQEFESNYQRVSKTIESWDKKYIFIFSQVGNAIELNQLLDFLDSISNHTRMNRYLRYVHFHSKGTLSELITGALLAHKDHIYEACVKQDWKRSSGFDLVMDGLIEEFEKHIVNTYLGTVWHTKYYSRGIRWEFEKFTEYIPYEINVRNWAEDNEKNRSYWNSTKFQAIERDRFISELQPRLCSVLRRLNFEDFEILLVLLPSGFLIQEFAKEVDVPVGWEQGVEYQEGYNKWAGNYTEEILVARPKAYAKHVFTFERPDVQNAVSLLEDMGKIHHAIQEYKRYHP